MNKIEYLPNIKFYGSFDIRQFKFWATGPGYGLEVNINEL